MSLSLSLSHVKFNSLLFCRMEYFVAFCNAIFVIYCVMEVYVFLPLDAEASRRRRANAVAHHGGDGLVAVVRALLELGADVEAPGQKGRGWRGRGGVGPDSSVQPC